MLEHIIIGGGFAFAAAAQPGPLQAFLLSRVIADGWKRTLPAALAPLMSDGPIAFLILTLLHNVTSGFESVLKGIGGIVFMYFAFRTFLEWQKMSPGKPPATHSSPQTLSQAVVVNLLNPGPYLGWSLILGPLVREAWVEKPANAVALVLSFYSVMVFSLSLFIILIGTTSLLGFRGRKRLLLTSSLVLAGIAVYSLWSSLT